jgi:hypothetical protein
MVRDAITSASPAGLDSVEALLIRVEANCRDFERQLAQEDRGMTTPAALTPLEWAAAMSAETDQAPVQEDRGEVGRPEASGDLTPETVQPRFPDEAGAQHEVSPQQRRGPPDA